MADLRFREQYLDAVNTVVSDEEYAGLDVLTNGDYHLDADFAGRSWFLYPVERLGGVAQTELQPTSRWIPRSAGSWLYEIVSGWRYPTVVGEVGAGIPLEFAKIWRTAQARATKPVKFGTISADLAAAALSVSPGVYPDDKRQLAWDLATVINGELRALAAAGCKVIQIEETAIHSLPPDTSQETLDFHVDLYHHQIEGLDDVEIWIHTCWGNPGAQRVIDANSYEATIDIYLNRMRADVWTIESKDAGHAPLQLFAAYKGKLEKKVAVGFVSHRTLQVETPEEVAADVRHALEFIDPEQLVLSSDCGFGRQGVPRPVALYKAAALARGANIVRRELGAPETPVPAADPNLQIDVLDRPA
jgi:5-methyltetrahydropteroyltriglutamate--homocysteine methyltransferase